MQVQVADAGTLRTSLTVSYSPAEVAARVDKVLGQLSQEVRLPGFRPGKTPRAVLQKRFGDAAAKQAGEDLLNEGLNQAIKDKGLKPIGPFTTDKRSDQDGLSITVSFDVKPTITLPEASGFSIPAAAVAVSDADIEQSIASLSRRAGSESELVAGETVIAEDSIVITGTVSVAGKEVRKLHDFQHLVGSYPLFGKEPADVVALVAGKGVGAELRFTSVLPKAFSPAEYVGKDAEIAVTIVSAKRLRAAAVDDALAKKFGFEELAKLRDYFRTSLQRSREDEQRRAQVDALSAQLTEKTPVTLPPALLAKIREDTAAQAVAKAKREGKAEADLAKIKTDAEAQAEKDLRRHMIMDALAEQLGITVTNDDFNDQIQMAAAQSGRRAEDVAAQLKSSGQANQVAMEIREAKALEQFLDRVLGTPATATAAG